MTREETKYRPKHWIMYYYGTENKALISCKPQSRWNLISKTDKKAILANKHTTIHLTTEDFEKRWVKVSEKKGKVNEQRRTDTKS